MRFYKGPDLARSWSERDPVGDLSWYGHDVDSREPARGLLKRCGVAPLENQRDSAEVLANLLAVDWGHELVLWDPHAVLAGKV